MSDSSLAVNGLSPAENAQLEALRRGDERAFAELVAKYHATMVRIAQIYVRDRDAAQEIAQEAWLGVLRGLSHFEGRSSLKTWLFTIVSNLAKTRGVREKRSLPFSELARQETANAEPSLSSDHFYADGEDAGWWISYPPQWNTNLEDIYLNQELMQYLEQAVAQLPEAQRTVITLRDLQGWSADDVCNVLKIGETNQRVLLHRARAKVRVALEKYFADARELTP